VNGGHPRNAVAYRLDNLIHFPRPAIQDPVARRTLTAWVVMEKPATRSSPEDGDNSVVSILIVVVLPAPLEPRNPKTSPPFSASASAAANAARRRVCFLISRTVARISTRSSLEHLDQGLKLHTQ